MENLAKKVFEIINNHSIETIKEAVKLIEFGGFGKYYEEEYDKLNEKYPIIKFKLEKIENSKNFLIPKYLKQFNHIFLGN